MEKKELLFEILKRLQKIQIIKYNHGFVSVTQHCSNSFDVCVMYENFCDDYQVYNFSFYDWFNEDDLKEKYLMFVNNCIVRPYLGEHPELLTI